MEKILLEAQADAIAKAFLDYADIHGLNYSMSAYSSIPIGIWFPDEEDEKDEAYAYGKVICKRLFELEPRLNSEYPYSISMERCSTNDIVITISRDILDFDMLGDDDISLRIHVVPPINKTTTPWQKRIRLFYKEGDFFFINSSNIENIIGVCLSDDYIDDLLSVSFLLEDHLNEKWQSSKFIKEKVNFILSNTFQKEFKRCFSNSEAISGVFASLFYQDSVYTVTMAQKKRIAVLSGYNIFGDMFLSSKNRISNMEKQYIIKYPTKLENIIYPFNENAASMKLVFDNEWALKVSFSCTSSKISPSSLLMTISIINAPSNIYIEKLDYSEYL